jgi:hypothetical protein
MFFFPLQLSDIPMARILFQSIRSQGALLPADYLIKIVEGKADGVTPEAYHLPPGSRLRSEAYQVYERLLKYWARFQEARKEIPDDQDGGGITNKEWTTHLLDELRWGRPNAGTGVVFNEREYKIKRFSGHVPLHLVGCNQPLDRRGSSTSIPHGMVQEFLNASDDHLWAIVTNGLQLRLLRDNPALSRMAFVEFDLEAMMEDPSLFPDFLIFWHLCHHSRLEHAVPEEAWLEKWSQGAIQDGAPVLDKLRVGVEQAVVHLGKGFLEHRANEALRGKIRSQELSALEYYRQLLRIIYRLLFLFVSEDRKLLHSPDASEDARKTFDEFYSTRRLRELADSMRGTPHADLWHQLSLLFHAMGDPEGCPQLGLPALGSFLWRANPSSTPDLDGPRPGSEGSVVQISNKNLLSAIRSIAYLQDDRDKAYRPVDFRVLDTQAFGSVYESLLELYPYFDTNGRNFELRSSSGADRKQTGSYYTPDSLVQCLLDSALEPVLKKRLEGKSSEEQEKALLSMKVCDPSVGSGHFLISAAHRLAYRLSRITSGDTEPSPEGYQEALRKVTANCLYGVDLNPMAVELCQFTLWLESVEPGKPFAFLDHHIQCGNSLLGVTPKLLTEGIPDGAFKPLEGDEKTVCTELAGRNRRERKDREKKQSRFDFGDSDIQVNFSDEFSKLSLTEDDSVSAVSQKEKIYNQLVGGDEYQNAKLLADLWCSVFTWKKDHSEAARLCPTDDDFLRFENNIESITAEVRAEVRGIIKQYNFFHWHLAFPEVFQLPSDGVPENARTGWNGGFDVILGNPPWEKIKITEREWFSPYDIRISEEKNSSKRKAIINDLIVSNPQLHSKYKDSLRSAKGLSHYLRNSSSYPLCGNGDINTFAVFSELISSLIQGQGQAGFIIPTGIATNKGTSSFFKKLVSKKQIISGFDFSNRRKKLTSTSKSKDLWFEDVGSEQRFMLLTIFGLTGSFDKPVFSSFCNNIEDTTSAGKIYHLTEELIQLFNPNTFTAPMFRTSLDVEIATKIYNKSSVLIDHSRNLNPWGVKLWTMFHMSNDSDKFISLDTEHTKQDLMPLYEAKMIHHYDHRWGTYESAGTGLKIENPSSDKKADPSYEISPRHWVKKSVIESKVNYPRSWFIGWRDIARATDERTTIASIIPSTAIGNKLPLFLMDNIHPSLQSCFLSVCSSFLFDYCSRQKIGEVTYNLFLMEQMPFPLPCRFLENCPWNPNLQLQEWIVPRVLELSYTSYSLKKFARDLGFQGQPFEWDVVRRSKLKAELDAAIFLIYGLNKDEVYHILESFDGLKKKEINEFGTFRSKELILRIYDQLSCGSEGEQLLKTQTDWCTSKINSINLK